MSQKIQAIRGMNDIPPQETPLWQQVEQTIQRVLRHYGYHEIRFPLMEKTELFQRSIGEVTDIVEKEMYTFADRNGDSVTLRPEGTASCVRAGLEQGLLYNQVQRLWYIGPMFRYERPQQGRYRQFHQIGAEVYGLTGPDIDAELIAMTARLWRMLGLSNVALELNSLGSNQARAAYRATLVDYLSAHQEQLDQDSQRRLHSNPLRILDSKNPDMQTLIAQAPRLLDYLDEPSQQHFATLQTLLDAQGIAYTINPRLVRGLDYYNRTVFEWVTTDLGAQGTLCAGGRYDGLVGQIGGHDTPAVGFAMGLERLVTLLAQNQTPTAHAPDVYLALVGDVVPAGLRLAEHLRDALPTLCLQTHCGGGNFKNQLKKADKSGAQIALILGETEQAEGKIIVKFLRDTQEQQLIEQEKLVNFLSST